MKLIAEVTQNVEAIMESDEKTGSKAMYITGPFMEYGIKNRNGRVYSEQVMRKAVGRYIAEKVDNSCAYGELNHPDGPHIDLNNVCILINSLDIQKGGQVIGKARVAETDAGRTVKGLIESGANLGVSSRGLGSLKENNGIMEVQDDFRLVTASDVVADPSAHSAFVKGIFEGVDWIFNENTGEWAEATRKILRRKNMRQIAEAQSQVFNEFLKAL